MKAVVAAFNQEKALVGAFSVLTNLRMEFFQALLIIMFAAYVMVIEARDENGNPGTGHLARARLVITVLDVNDVPPLFKRRKYEGFMSSDLTRLRNNLQVEAVDLDKTGTRNSDVRCGHEQNYLLNRH